MDYDDDARRVFCALCAEDLTLRSAHFELLAYFGRCGEPETLRVCHACELCYALQNCCNHPLNVVLHNYGGAAGKCAPRLKTVTVLSIQEKKMHRV